MGRDRDAGFTLLEVIVGFAIAAFALIGLFRAGSGGLLAVESAGGVEEAVQRAQSHLAAVGAGGTLSVGRSAGEDGNGYRWHLKVQPVPEADPVDRGGLPELFDVEVAVSWGERGHGGSVTLTSRRLGIAAASP